MQFKHFLIFVSFLGLIGCAHQSRKDQNSVRHSFENKDFNSALEILEGSSLKKDKENQLLYLMESATIYYYKKNYRKASKVYFEASELVDKLYTKSIKEAIASSILNDNSKSYYGSAFERSLLYYYQAMSFYKDQEKGFYYKKIKGKDGEEVKEKIEYTEDQKNKKLQQVRNVLIAWDSFFQDLKRMKGVKTFLKDDLLSKIMAAQIHERLGKKRDNEIALQLYRDARVILLKLGPAYSVFNKEYKKYNSELRNLYDKKIKSKGLKSKKYTNFYKKNKDFLTYKILSLVKKMKPYNLSREKRKLKPSKELLEKIKSTNNVSVIIESGHINQLTGKDFSFNLRSALEKIEDPTSRALVEGIGVPILTYFAMGPLGLGYVSHHGNVTVYSSHNVGKVITKEVGVEFELPFVEEVQKVKILNLNVYQGEKLVKKQELTLLHSLSGSAYINAQEMIENSFEKRSLRVGVKYAMAIVAAYGTYKRMKESSGELFAKPAALAQFLISQKAIKETEKADVRHWSTLPDSLHGIDLKLADGEYRLELEEVDGQGTVLAKQKLGQITVNAKEKSLFSYRAY